MSKITFLTKVNAVYHGDDDVPGNPLLAMQIFQEELNKPCPKSYIKKDWQGNLGLPISYVEQMLDGYFLGNWSVDGIKWKQIENEITLSLVVCTTNPITGQIRCLTGAAAGQISTYSTAKKTGTKEEIGAMSRDLSRKIPNTLEGDFPSIKSMAVKNAVKQLGRRFGRDINRKDKSAHNPNALTEDQANEVNETLEALATRGEKVPTP